MIVVDDSPEVDHEIFESHDFDSSDWVLIAEDIPLDEHQRDELVERFQRSHQDGGERALRTRRRRRRRRRGGRARRGRGGRRGRRARRGRRPRARARVSAAPATDAGAGVFIERAPEQAGARRAARAAGASTTRSIRAMRALCHRGDRSRLPRARVAPRRRRPRTPAADRSGAGPSSARAPDRHERAPAAAAGGRDLRSRLPAVQRRLLRRAALAGQALAARARSSSAAVARRTSSGSPPTGQLSSSRLPALFLTLERNRHWWTTEPLLSSGQRVSFPASKIVWEYYAGQGIEIQWLGTFGEANGYFLSGHENSNLRQLLGEVIPLAAHRAGGIAWEYLFRFDGGSPPWTSGLSQGTALQVLARAWSRFKEPALLTAAQQALGIFQKAPPQGVRVATHAGADVRRVHLRARRPHPQRLHPGARRPLRLHLDHEGPARPVAVPGRRRGGARGGAPLRHGRVVAVRPVRRIQPQLPRTAHRIPAAPVRTHAQGAAAGSPPPRPRPPTPAPAGTPAGGTASGGRARRRRAARTPRRAARRPRRSPATRSTARPPSASTTTSRRRPP